jgi:3-oxoacyl-[acyl-carrier protein] reductase
MTQEDFSGRVALVTGGSGGIGGELSARLAEAGAAVAVHYAGNRASAERVAAGIADDGGRAATFAADLREGDAPMQLADAVEAELGPVDILVANAGLSHPRVLPTKCRFGGEAGVSSESVQFGWRTVSRIRAGW